MDRNLISFAKVTDKYKVVSIGDSSKIYNEDNELIAIAWKSNRIYKTRVIRRASRALNNFCVYTCHVSRSTFCACADNIFIYHYDNLIFKKGFYSPASNLASQILQYSF